MLEIAGLVVTSIGLAVDLAKKFADWAKWEERDVEVDCEWLQLALEKGVLDGTEQDYDWRMLKNAPTLELQKTHSVVVALNRQKKIRYRIVKKTKNKELAILLKRLGR